MAKILEGFKVVSSYFRVTSSASHATVFSCDYKKSRAKSLWLRDRYKHKWSRPLIGLPPGTVLADSIKLTLKIARG